MPDTISTGPAAEPARRKSPKNAPKLRDGVMKRGRTWSYVIRVKDPEMGSEQAPMGWWLCYRTRSQSSSRRGPGAGPPQ